MKREILGIRQKFFLAFLSSMFGALLLLPLLVQSKKPVNNDLWPEIAQNIRLNYQIGQHPEVDEQIHWYIQHPKILQSLLNNAEPYLYYVYHQIRQRHLPAELVLIPIIESNYNPFAQSSMGAIGLWQMMPGTAADYGLKWTEWFDDRLDIVASTKAALDHFSALHAYFGDWLLVFAAYDAGAGTVRATIHQNKELNQPTDIWSLALPMDARSYVTKVVALATILKNPQRFHIALPAVANEPFFAAYAWQQITTLNKIAHATETDMAIIRRLNPGYRLTSTTAPKGNYALLIPKDKASLLEKNKTFQVEPAFEQSM